MDTLRLWLGISATAGDTDLLLLALCGRNRTSRICRARETERGRGCFVPFWRQACGDVDRGWLVESPCVPRLDKYVCTVVVAYRPMSKHWVRHWPPPTPPHRLLRYMVTNFFRIPIPSAQCLDSSSGRRSLVYCSHGLAPVWLAPPCATSSPLAPAPVPPALPCLLLVSPPVRAAQAARQRVFPVAVACCAQKHQDQMGAHSHRPGHWLLRRVPVLPHPAKGQAHAGRTRHCRHKRGRPSRPAKEKRKDTAERTMVR